jgi:two-component system NtrC family sensor kinase
MRVRTKLIIGFFAIAMLIWIIASHAVNSLDNLKDQYATIEKNIIPGTLAMNEVEKVANGAYHEIMKYILYDDASAKEAASAHLSRLQEIETGYFPYGTNKAEEFMTNQILMGKIADLYFSFGILMDYKRRGATYEELLARDRTTSLPALLALQQEITERKEQYMKDLSLAKNDFNKAYTRGVNTLFISVGVVTILAGLSAWLTTRSILRPLLVLRKGTDMIARGNLKYKVGTRARDEIGQLSRAFDRMTESLSTSMTSIENLNKEIAERRQAEEALREIQEFNESLLENSPHSTIVINPDTSIRYVNPAWEKLNGWTLEEIKGIKAPNYPWWPDDLRETFYEGFKEAMEQDSGSGEVIAQKKSGGTYWISMNWTSVKHDGEMQYLLINSVDITERKEAEEALNNEAIRRRIFIEQSRDGIVVLDEEGQVYEANQRFAEMLGYTMDEVLKLSVWDWEYQFPREQVAEMVATVDESGDHFETKHLRKDGTIFDVEITSNAAVFGGQKLIFCVCRDITKRKQAEEALRQSEEKFSKAFHASPNSISISTLKEGIFIEVNDSFVRDKGYTRDEVIGRTSAELNLFGNLEMRKDIVNILKKKGRVDNEPIEFRTKNGEIRTGLLSAESITINDEPCMIVINTDITKRKQAEKRLRLLGSVTQQVLDATIVTDLKFNITYMNKAAEKLLGYPFEEARSKNLAYFDIQPLPRHLSQEIMRTVSNGKVWTATVTKQRKDGRVITCDCRLSPLYDENNQIMGYIDVERDVTAQKETEVKLQINQLMIENILASMPGGVLVIDDNNRILLANESFRSIFQTGDTPVEGQSFSELIPIKKLINDYHAIKRGEKENTSLEFRYTASDIEKIINCDIIPMDEGRTLLTFTDISREREEEEKLYLTDRLASIGEMAAGLAHELNNPLTGILALTQLLINSELPPEYREDLGYVHSEAKRAADIVKNVLLFARNNNYENGHASANEVIQNVLRLREYEEKINNITVNTNFTEDIPDVSIDKFQLQQVLLNMVLNAEAAIMETGKPGELTVTTERANNHVNIIFSDSGCGIKKQILPRIFDPFFTTKDIGKGTGLGLSICYGIVVKNGGNINVESKVNKGTTFTIRMPVVC